MSKSILFVSSLRIKMDISETQYRLGCTVIGPTKHFSYTAASTATR